MSDKIRRDKNKFFNPKYNCTEEIIVYPYISWAFVQSAF